MLRKLSIFTAIILLIPLGTWALRWQWQTGDYYVKPALDYGLYMLTETGSMPLGLLTSLLLMCYLMWLVRARYDWRLVLFVCICSLAGTQLLKAGGKALCSEPRPFVENMTDIDYPAHDFYAISRPARSEFVENFYTATEYPWLARHHAKETGYSFPSGHTIFAVSWLLLFVGFLYGQGGLAARISLFCLLVWAGLMLISRLRLGMHYPIDLLASTLISWAFHLALFCRLVPKLETLKLFKRG